jgi:hypothetical protein
MTRSANENPWATIDPRRRYPDEPVVDDESDAVLVVAVNDLIMLRSPMWHGDSGAVLHALASLAAQITDWLPDAVADARDQDYSWPEIAHLLGTRTSSIQRRYTHHARTRRQPLEAD